MSFQKFERLLQLLWGQVIHHSNVITLDIALPFMAGMCFFEADELSVSISTLRINGCHFVTNLLKVNNLRTSTFLID